MAAELTRGWTEDCQSLRFCFLPVAETLPGLVPDSNRSMILRIRHEQVAAGFNRHNFKFTRRAQRDCLCEGNGGVHDCSWFWKTGRIKIVA